MSSGITLQEVGGSLVVNVPEEQTQIGRGQFLQVTDKRVSRSHALLNIAEKKLYITPTHTNPCFLRRHNSKEQTVMTKDVKTLLNHGDIFGLLPDQLFYKVLYPQVNGNKTVADKVEQKEEKKELQNGKLQIDVKPASDKKPVEDKPKTDDDENPPEEEEDQEEDDDKADEEEEEDKKLFDEKSEVKEKHEADHSSDEIALPLDKKRPLPDWMHKVSNAASPQKSKASPKKVKSPAVNKREAGQKLTKTNESNADKEDEEEDDDEEEEEVELPIPVKIIRAKPRKDSDEEEDFDNPSDDDYIPEDSPPKKQTSRQRKRYSDSEEDISNDDDDDDDYAPSKKRSRAKKTPKKGKKAASKGRPTPSRSAKKGAGRSRKRYNSDDDDDMDEEVVSPRKRPVPDDEGRGRPRRAATQNRGSYVDDPLIEEALEDFASEHSENDGMGEKDSDFELHDALDSGSDLDKKGKKPKGVKTLKVAKSPRSVTKKGKKKAPRRASKTKNYSDDDGDDDDEDDEPYVPRPSKRRGATASQESGESDEDKKKRRRREPCQYGKKCYRKNPVHFRTFCHPGDSSYDEEDKDGSGSPTKDVVKKTKDTNKTLPEKPSRPQRSTAGTRLVPQGAIDDDAPDTYDYNDSFINDGTQPSDEEEDSGQDSDYEGDSIPKKTSKSKNLVTAAD